MMMGTKGLGLCPVVAHMAGEFQPVHRLHRQVGEDQVGFALAQRVDGGLAVAGFGDVADADEFSSARSSERICALSSTISALRFSKPPDIRLLCSGRGSASAIAAEIAHREVTSLRLGNRYRTRSYVRRI